MWLKKTINHIECLNHWHFRQEFYSECPSCNLFSLLASSNACSFLGHCESIVNPDLTGQMIHRAMTTMCVGPAVIINNILLLFTKLIKLTQIFTHTVWSRRFSRNYLHLYKKGRCGSTRQWTMFLLVVMVVLKPLKTVFLKQFPFSEDTLRYPSTLLNRTDICHHISGGTTCSKSGRHGGKGVVGKFGWGASLLGPLPKKVKLT